MGDALGEICPINGEQLDVGLWQEGDLHRGRHPASTENRRPNGEDVECRVGLKAQKANDRRRRQAEQDAQLKVRPERTSRLAFRKRSSPIFRKEPTEWLKKKNPLSIPRALRNKSRHSRTALSPSCASLV